MLRMLREVNHDEDADVGAVEGVEEDHKMDSILKKIDRLKASTLFMLYIVSDLLLSAVS